MTNTLGIMTEILKNYPWTRLSVRIIGAIKRQFFHMVTHSNLSQEIFAIDDTWEAVICFLGWGGGGVFAMLGYPGMCHFPGYTFCPKILKQGILFAQKF